MGTHHKVSYANLDISCGPVFRRFGERLNWNPKPQGLQVHGCQNRVEFQDRLVHQRLADWFRRIPLAGGLVAGVPGVTGAGRRRSAKASSKKGHADKIHGQL